MNDDKIKALNVVGPDFKEGYMMTEIIEGVWFIAGVDDMIPDSHVYVIGDPSSQDLSIIDAGLMGKGNYKLQTIPSNPCTPSGRRVLQLRSEA